ncbi:MAG: Clp1/GlmU family protein [Methanomassiliicoccales archaeon]|jgi:polynucleotide 5'-hydroxyl-kinase GRC3/NOL9|nr:Clp1/GlmU family protein [Methanomassiliicoccales archaeon]
MIELELCPDSTLLVDGPASVWVESGIIEVFGAEKRAQSMTIVKENRRLPFYAIAPAKIKMRLGVDSTYTVKEGNTIPRSWIECADAIIKKTPPSVAIIGGNDSGKSSLGLYLINRCIRDGLDPVCFIDTDLGQSEIGPPGTIGFVILREQTTDLQLMSPDWTMFLGVTSPYSVQKKVLSMAEKLLEKVKERRARIIIMNTDGWVGNDEALNYKRSIIGLLPSPLVIVITKDAELNPLLQSFSNDFIVVEPPLDVKPRSPETRRRLRELIFAKYLKEGRIRVFRNDRVVFGKDWQNSMGRLIGLLGTDGKLLGIGVVVGIDVKNGVLKVFTPVDEKVARVVIGGIRIERNGR